MSEKQIAKNPITADMVTLRILEDRILTHMQGAYSNLLQVGRCLVQAKEMSLVPHGEWESWVQKNTGMSERSAQRLMQAARSVPEGSAMERLPISKIQAILALPEGQREEMAEKAESESMTVKELRNEIAKLAGDVERERAEKKLAAQQYAQESLLKQRQIDDLRGRFKGQVEMNGKLNSMRQDAIREADALKLQLDELLARPAAGISAEAQQEIDRLRAELADAEEYAAQQADLRQEAQESLMNFQQGRENELQPVRRFDAGDLAAAVGSFIGAAGVIPHMGAEICKMSAGDRADMALQISRIAEWLDGARRAMNTEMLEL